MTQCTICATGHLLHQGSAGGLARIPLRIQKPKEGIPTTSGSELQTLQLLWLGMAASLSQLLSSIVILKLTRRP